MSAAYNPAWGFDQYAMPPKGEPLYPPPPDRRKPRRLLTDPKNKPVADNEMTEEVAA